MSSNSRFLFDNEFVTARSAVEKKSKEPKLPPAIYTEDQYQAALASAFEKGRLQGEQVARNDQEAADNALLENINQQIGSLHESQSQTHSNIKMEAAEFALLVAQKLAPALLEKSAITEIYKLVDDCLADLVEEPRVVVRASEHICDNIKSRMDALTLSSGFQGQLILLPDDNITGADCRVEWADGGVERNSVEISQKISQIVDRYVNSLTA